MFMVRKMATGSSGDRVCVCVCHAVRCKVVINNSTQRNGAEAIQGMSASRESERQSSKCEKYVLHFGFCQ